MALFGGDVHLDFCIDAKESPHDICLLRLQNLFIERVISLMRFSMELSIRIIMLGMPVANSGIIRLLLYMITYLPVVHFTYLPVVHCEQSDFCDDQGVI